MSERETELKRDDLELPALLKEWPTPWYVTSDGIKDARGCWIMTGSNNRMNHEMVELANFAGEAWNRRAS